ncbi:tetratricopeptide repeat protein [Pseudoalteromonas sp. XMcav1-K]|uniref:tetratricopeptide repeat protein n=1 Tax=Pseudoalteromonas sp. XMcav1-K TaxID=3374372 RepID=UPI003756C799
MRFVFLLIITFSTLLRADPIDEKLQEAKDYLTVKPSKSYEILTKLQQTTGKTTQQQIDLNILIARAALPLDKLDELYLAVEDLFEHHNHPYFTENITTVTSALGIWLRKNNYLEDAQLSFECSYQHAKNDRLKLILNNSLALVVREVNNLERAKSLFEYSFKLAKASRNVNMMGMTSHNLGLIALEQGKISVAEQRFRDALEYYTSINKRAGNINTGMYLLLTFVIQEQLTNFQRLYAPISRKAEAFPNERSHALLAWVHARYLELKGQKTSAAERTQLLQKFAYIVDYREQVVVEKYLAQPMGILLAVEAPKVQSSRFDAPWFAYVKSCDFSQKTS